MLLGSQDQASVNLLKQEPLPTYLTEAGETDGDFNTVQLV
jgi:hypothetical protein